MMQLRATVVGKDTRIAFLVEDLRQLKASIPKYEQGTRLLKKVEQLGLRVAKLETQNSQLRVQLGAAQRTSEIAGMAERAEARRPSAMPALPMPAEAPITLHLQHKTVLCVGGRNGNVANYRDIIEKAGGSFAHHDGGLEDKQSHLDASLAAADLVICRTGCINHNAYWRVKDFCKRTGKQCVFVENPSTSSLARCLQQVVLDEVAQ